MRLKKYLEETFEANRKEYELCIKNKDQDIFEKRIFAYSNKYCITSRYAGCGNVYSVACGAGQPLWSRCRANAHSAFIYYHSRRHGNAGRFINQPFSGGSGQSGEPDKNRVF